MLGDPEQGFVLESNVLAAHYVPVDHVSEPVGVHPPVLGTLGAREFDAAALASGNHVAALGAPHYYYYRVATHSLGP